MASHLLMTSLILGILSVAPISCNFKPEMSNVSMQEQEDGKWDKDAFTVRPWPLADESGAIWLVTQDGTDSTPKDTSLSPKNYKIVLNAFERQSEQRRKRGIFIESRTFATQPTPEDEEWMSTLERKLRSDPQWRKYESDLIEELRAECQKRNIPLYLNLTLTLPGKWKKIAPPSQDN